MSLKETLLKLQDEFITEKAISECVTEEDVIYAWIREIKKALEDIDNDL